MIAKRFAVFVQNKNFRASALIAFFVKGHYKQPPRSAAPGSSFCSAQRPWGLFSSGQWMWLLLSYLQAQPILRVSLTLQ